MEPYVSCNPATGAAAGTFASRSEAEVAERVAHARGLSEAWRLRSVPQRLDALRRWRLRLAGDSSVLAATVSAEIGKPMQEALGADLMPALAGLRWLENRAERTLRGRREGAALLTAEPYGVVGVIGTWNYPLLLNVTPIAWALAAGSAVVFKPSELATASALRMAEHADAVGLPVITITGGPETGRSLCRAAIDKLAFTGAVQTGRHILRELAARGTPAVMELAGNDALLVCADADMAGAARAAVWGRVCNAGQSCIAPQRIYVAQERFDSFLGLCEREMERLRPGIDYGPMRTSALRDHAHQLVREAIAQGAQRRLGGRPLSEFGGFHYAPTLLAGCTDRMRVMTEPFYGPVLPVCSVPSIDEAVERINADEMALGASVWTRDVAGGRLLGKRLRVGIVAINQDTLLLAANPALPFGGLRSSGFGKQRGAAGLEEFFTWKVSAAARHNGGRRHLFPYTAQTAPLLEAFIAFQNAPDLRTRIHGIRRLAGAAARYKRHDRSG